MIYTKVLVLVLATQFVTIYTCFLLHLSLESPVINQRKFLPFTIKDAHLTPNRCKNQRFCALKIRVLKLYATKLYEQMFDFCRAYHLSTNLIVFVWNDSSELCLTL